MGPDEVNIFFLGDSLWVASDFALISNSDIDRPKLIARGKWAGKKLQKRLTRRDDSRQYHSASVRTMRKHRNGH
jgi:hypothetical protein